MNYELTYWSGLINNQGQHEIELVVIEAAVVESLLSKIPPKFIEVINVDGEVSIINTNNINQLREVFESGNPQGE